VAHRREGSGRRQHDGDHRRLRLPAHAEVLPGSGAWSAWTELFCSASCPTRNSGERVEKLVLQAEHDMRAALERERAGEVAVPWRGADGAHGATQPPGQGAKGPPACAGAPRCSSVCWCEHEPDHPMLVQAVPGERRTPTWTCHGAHRLPGQARSPTLDWRLVEVPVVSPFCLRTSIASKIKEGLMLEDPEEAIERLWQDFQRKTHKPNEAM
jgi:hypothetical protein